jgi:protein ImuA
MLSLGSSDRPGTIARHSEVVEELRRLLPRLEGFSREPRALALGLPALDARLPQGGLAFGVLHEIAPAATSDMPAAFGFAASLLGRMPAGMLLVVTTRAVSHWGRLSGHGLNRLGLDPARLILVETAGEQQALWALEEALRSAAPVAVAGAIGARLDLKASQRLSLAASHSGVPCLLLRPLGAEPSAAVTRWRIGVAAAARDSFGLVTGARWRVTLERCRNGRTGEWLMEFDHAAHRFSLVAALADPAFPRDANPFAPNSPASSSLAPSSLGPRSRVPNPFAANLERTSRLARSG